MGDQLAADEDTVREVIHPFNEIWSAWLDPEWVGGRPCPEPDDEAKLAVIEDTLGNRPGRTFAVDGFGSLGIRSTAGAASGSRRDTAG